MEFLNEIFKDYEYLDILVYCIMDNHTHLLIHTDDISQLSKAMARVNTKYAIYYNKQEERVGYVFRNRYYSKQITSKDHLYSTIVYIHTNPIKSKITNNLSNYKYCSYNEFKNNKIDSNCAKILFNTKNHIKIFNYIHDKYKGYIGEDIVDISKRDIKEIQKTMEEFYNEYKVDFKSIKQNNYLLIKLVYILKNQNGLKDKEINELLNIGKNRIKKMRKNSHLI